MATREPDERRDHGGPGWLAAVHPIGRRGSSPAGAARADRSAPLLRRRPRHQPAAGHRAAPRRRLDRAASVARPCGAPKPGWRRPRSLFAAFAAVRADPTIVFLDVLTSLALAGGSLAAFGGLRVVARPFWSLVGLGVRRARLGDGRRRAGHGRAREASMPSIGSARGRVSRSLPVLRGLAVAIPVVLVFVALFSAADAVFAELVGDLFGVRHRPGRPAGQRDPGAALGWVAAGGLAFAAAEHADEDTHAMAPSERLADRHDRGGHGPRRGRRRVRALRRASRAPICSAASTPSRRPGISYAEYARRGFFELVAVAVPGGRTGDRGRAPGPRSDAPARRAGNRAGRA